MKDFKKELVFAINKYGDNNIDIVMDTDKSIAYGGFHSDRDSFSVTQSYTIKSIDATRLSNELNIGYFEL